MSLITTDDSTNLTTETGATVGSRRRRLIVMSIFGLLISALSARAQTLGRGEWFRVNIAGYMSEPKLIEGQLIPSGESKLEPVRQVGDSFGYSPQDNLQVPEAFTFRWRAVGDTKLHERVFRVRSRLPKEVIEKLTTPGRSFNLALDFRVRNSRPELLWELVDLRGPRGRRIEPLYEGVLPPE